MGNSQGKIRKLKKSIENGGYGKLIIRRSKSQQGVDTRIDRLSGEFQKNGNSEESPELERERYQDSGGLGEMWTGVNIWIITQFRKGRGGLKKKREKAPKKTEKKRKSKPSEVRNSESPLSLLLNFIPCHP